MIEPNARRSSLIEEYERYFSEKLGKRVCIADGRMDDLWEIKITVGGNRIEGEFKGEFLAMMEVFDALNAIVDSEDRVRKELAERDRLAMIYP